VTAPPAALTAGSDPSASLQVCSGRNYCIAILALRFVPVKPADGAPVEDKALMRLEFYRIAMKR
jgi:hypothetical protein